MDNNALTELMIGIGMLTELWTIAYKGFISQGLSEDKAMAYTKGFMSAMIDFMVRMPNNGQEDLK